MPSDVAERLLGDEDVAVIREEVKAAISEDSMTRSAAAREVGIAEPTFLAFLSGTYQGRNDRIALEARKWLNARKERQATRRAIPTPPAFIETPTAEAMMLVLRGAQHMPDFAVVAGPPGIGKTFAARAYQRANPNVWMLTGHPSLNSPRSVMDELCRVLGLLDSRALHKMQRLIIEKLRGTGALLIVDEANHLSSLALDQLRSIHDEARIGIALVGNGTVFSRLEGNGRTAEFAQLFSRVGLRLTSKRDHDRRLGGDIEALLNAWPVEDPKVRRLLTAIARKPGALRGMTKTLTLAHMLAAGAGETLGAQHVTLAWQRLAEAAIEPGAAGEAA